MTSAEFVDTTLARQGQVRDVECERIQATVGDNVWLDPSEWDRLQAGSIIYIDRVTGKQLHANQCGVLDYGNGDKHRHVRLLSVMLRVAY